jgi:eukaryotic-like serine/threonine-protein kinase
MIQPGQLLFHRYEIVKLLGRGVSSRLYLASDTFLERTVALKAFEDVPDEPTLARIQREAKIYSQLVNEKIVRLLDVARHDRNIYFVLDYIDGQNLAARIISHPPPLKQILVWTSDILAVLAYIHSVNVIHRDIKPSNILIRSADLSLHLSDFGTSKVIDVDDELTTIGTLVGTIVYAAPEQLDGEPATPAVDVYSTGAVLYEMLTGRRYNGEGRLRADTRISDIKLTRPNVPSAVIDLIKRMVISDPRRRPSSDTALGLLNSIISSVDWNMIDDNGIQSIARDPALSVAPIPPVSGTSDLSATMISNVSTARATGFFADQALRVDAYHQSVDFFRSHLDSDYRNLLFQAKLAFALWLGCAAIAFGVVLAGIVLLFQGNSTNGAITLASDVLVLFIQRIFKEREEYYREQASQKHTHLQMGNAWTLAVQSLDGISDSTLREQKLGALSDALVNAFGPGLFVSETRATSPKLKQRGTLK